MFGPVFLVILGIVGWIVLALWPASIAKRKGHSFFLFLLLGILTSFILSLIVALLVSDKTQTTQDRADEEAVERALEKEEDRV